MGDFGDFDGTDGIDIWNEGRLFLATGKVAKEALLCDDMEKLDPYLRGVYSYADIDQIVDYMVRNELLRIESNEPSVDCPRTRFIIHGQAYSRLFTDADIKRFSLSKIMPEAFRKLYAGTFFWPSPASFIHSRGENTKMS